jgi:outer membrane protein assembly factor BamA
LTLVFFSLLKISSASPAYAAEPEKKPEDLTGYTIRKILIVRDNVFDLSDPKESGWVGRAGNSFHVVTKEEIIAFELLFKEGEFYDIKKIEESERNLRKYPFLTEVNIKPVPDHENRTVDVVVHTRDQWSFIIGGTFGLTSESAEIGIDIGEHNLFGTGQTVKYSIRSTNEGVAQSIGFRDDTVYDSRYSLTLGHSLLKSERKYTAVLQKPFYTIMTKNSHGVTYFYQNYHSDILTYNNYRAQLFYAFSRPLSHDDILRTYLILSLGEEMVEHPITYTDRDNQLNLSFNFLLNPYSYEKETYLESFREKEDVKLGTVVSLSIGRRLEELGSSSSETTGGVAITKNFKLRERDYLFTEIILRNHDRFFRKQYYTGMMKYYWRDFENHSVVLHVIVAYQENIVKRFSLGGMKWLRGFKKDSYIGKNMLVINLEDRIFTYKSFFYGTIEPGFVVFTDLGEVWRNGPGDEFDKLHQSVGAGLRFAVLKSPGVNLVRIDYGVPVDGSSGPYLTIGVEGVF